MSISSTIDERYRKQYFVAFILITLLVWSPLKAVANIAPYIFVVATIFLFRGKVFKINRILINRLIGFVLGFVLILTTYWLLYPGEFLFFNAFFSLITYSLVIVLLCIPSKGLGDPRLLYKMAAYTFPFVFLESIIGLVQAVYGFFITGTFDGVNG
ncbi:MAG: hypothetical protein HRT61_18985, partial [Ekhidna sp.]|nr:hypothetical protein [Ekhidna sp.]